MRLLRAPGPFLPTLAALLAVMGGFGCGGGNEDLKKQVRALETQVTSLRADADRLEERLQAVELGAAVPGRTAGEARTQDARLERPRLKTIHLAPDDERPAPPPTEVPATPETESEGVRPVIRGTGDRVIKTGDAGPSGRFSPGHDRYAEGLSLARRGELTEAIHVFERYALTHPTSPYADNALFWAGWCHAALGDTAEALARYTEVVRLHPRGSKAPAARSAAARLQRSAGAGALESRPLTGPSREARLAEEAARGI
jgi:TolA-binding protein